MKYRFEIRKHKKLKLVDNLILTLLGSSGLNIVYLSSLYSKLTKITTTVRKLYFIIYEIGKKFDFPHAEHSRLRKIFFHKENYMKITFSDFS